MTKFTNNGFIPRYDNDVEALIPELWAHESIAVLEENMVIGNLVHRDFEDEVAKLGDTVNTRKPGNFKGKRKGRNDDVTIQDATSTNVAVVLNQHIHTSFLLRDGETTLAMKDLVKEYLEPALIAQAGFLDAALLGQSIQFYANGAGTLGGLTASNAKSGILNARGSLNTNKAPMRDRNMIWTVDGETAALNTDLFISAEKVGDDGTALREASLGRKLGFNHFMSQNASSTTADEVNDVILVNNAAGYPAGATTIATDGAGTTPAVNGWITIAGDDTPQRVTANAGGSLTISPGLKLAVADDAEVRRYAAGAVNLAAGYAAGYEKGIVVDGAATFRAGQFVTFGTNTAVAPYCIIDVDGAELTLDRPLDAAIADDEVINVGPGGQYNFAFHRNALALVVRPLALPEMGTGALAANVSHNGYAMRAVITYDGTKQGHLVTLDMIAGIKVLDTALGLPFYG